MKPNKGYDDADIPDMDELLAMEEERLRKFYGDKEDYSQAPNWGYEIWP